MPPRRKPPVRSQPPRLTNTAASAGTDNDQSVTAATRAGAPAKRTTVRPSTRTNAVNAASTARRKAAPIPTHPTPDRHQKQDHDNQLPQWPAFSVRRHSFLSPLWPHANVNSLSPEMMAAAGFYFDPAATDPDNPDNAACFQCGKQLSNWDPDHDDPATIHVEKSPECPYARAICRPKLLRQWTANAGDASNGQFFDAADPTSYPKSDEMVQARLQTFQDRWVHDHDRKYFANSTRMAKAGFVYDPNVLEEQPNALDDNATCVYCNLSLGNWEPKDNPLTEHKTRNPTCPFFAHITKPRGKRAPLTAPVTRRAQSPATTPDSEPAALEPVPEPSGPKRGRGRPRKEVPHETNATAPEEAAPEAPKRGRGRPRKPEVPIELPATVPEASAADEPGPDAPSGQPIPTLAMTRRAAAKRKAPSSDTPEETVADAAVTRPRTRQRTTPAAPAARTTRRRAQQAIDQEAVVKQESVDTVSDEPPLKRQRVSLVPPAHVVEVEIPLPQMSLHPSSPAPRPATPSSQPLPLMSLEEMNQQLLAEPEPAAPTATRAKRAAAARKPPAGRRAPARATRATATANPSEKVESPGPEAMQVDKQEGTLEDPAMPLAIKTTYGRRSARGSLDRPHLRLPLSPQRLSASDLPSPTPVDSPARSVPRRSSGVRQDPPAPASKGLVQLEAVELPDTIHHAWPQKPIQADPLPDRTARHPGTSSKGSRSSRPSRPHTAPAPPAPDLVVVEDSSRETTPPSSPSTRRAVAQPAASEPLRIPTLPAILSPRRRSARKRARDTSQVPAPSVHVAVEIPVAHDARPRSLAAFHSTLPGPLLALVDHAALAAADGGAVPGTTSLRHVLAAHLVAKRRAELQAEFDPLVRHLRSQVPELKRRALEEAQGQA